MREHQNMEWKESWRDDYLRWICGFANAEGEVAGEVAAVQPESLRLRVLAMLADGPLSKAQISSRLGHKEISGQLNKVMRLLLAEDNIEYTLPNKPSSRLQKYRLTAKGHSLLPVLHQGKTRP